MDTDLKRAEMLLDEHESHLKAALTAVRSARFVLQASKGAAGLYEVTLKPLAAFEGERVVSLRGPSLEQTMIDAQDAFKRENHCHDVQAHFEVMLVIRDFRVPIPQEYWEHYRT